MNSGGTVTFDPSRLQRTDYNDGELTEAELNKGIRKTENETQIEYVEFQGKRYKWTELRQAIQEAAKSYGRGQSRAGANLDPSAVLAQINAMSIRPISDTTELDQKLAELQAARSDLQAKREAMDSAAAGTVKTAATSARDEAAQKVRELETQLRQLTIQARQRGVPERQLNTYAQVVGDPVREDGNTGNGNGTATFRAMQAPQSQQGPSGGQGAQNGQNGQGARGMGFGGASAMGGGYGYPFGGGMEPPTSAAYASALYMGDSISEGLGMIGRSQREGQKLMLLFFYYARMAESGDIGAMYQLIKFCNYIIAKDKARQNIQITTKLIQLQDLSRKSTEALMSVATDDPEKQADFTKALHKAKSEEQTIATSQKLLADMLQEFAQVVESLTNSTKFLLEAEGRIMRTVTRP